MLLFEDKIVQNRDAFIAKVKAIAASMSIDPNWLMGYMNSETGGTFSPSIRNKKSGAVGLAQILPSTAVSLGTTADALASMDSVQQLDWVKKYFWPYRNHINSYDDLYLIGFYPNADRVFAGTLSKPDSWHFPAAVSAQNPGIDTIADLKAFIYKNIPAEWQPQINQQPELATTVKKYTRRNWILITLALGSTAVGIYLIATSKTAQ